jgi:GT2 family glycosyltransferase
MSADFFAEGGVLIRRDAYLEVGGFFEPYFFTCSEIDLATRLLAAGWDVRYFPAAEFDHMKPEGHGAGSRLALQYRIRNNAWYYWLHFPPAVAARRIPAYLAFDLIESVHRGMPGVWPKGIREAWTQRGAVRRYRRPVPRDLVSRIEIKRGRLHLKILGRALRRRLTRA